MRTLHWTLLTSLLSIGVATASRADDQPFVPGSGVKVTQCGDNFESPDWRYIMNGPKASHEQDEQQRPPGGRSVNGRWYEGAKRGQPDVARRIATPPGGLPGSKGSLFLATKFSGIPGRPSGEQMQDDLLMSVESRLGRPIPVSWSPSCVVRVYLPDFHRWEDRSGASFGIRADVKGRTPDGSIEPYWPGTFIMFRSETSSKYPQDFAQLMVRARPNGQDVPGPVINEPGWWTFGLSFTPDGQVHQYARPGVEDLTEDDHLYSSFPYGNKCLEFNNFFFNVANMDNGKTWSTPWVVDDPELYVIPPQGQTIANLPRKGGGAVAGRSKNGESRSALGKAFGWK